MKSILAGAIALSVSAGAIADDDGPMKPVNDLFDAMRASDEAAMIAPFVPGVKLRRLRPDGTFSDTPVEAFAKNMSSNFKPGEADEKLFDITVEEYGHLASAWTPFKIYIKGELAACGVNHFRLVKIGDEWKIESLMDVPRRPEKCDK